MQFHPAVELWGNSGEKAEQTASMLFCLITSPKSILGS